MGIRGTGRPDVPPETKTVLKASHSRKVDAKQQKLADRTAAAAEGKICKDFEAKRNHTYTLKS
jgi:hypothetical protein